MAGQWRQPSDKGHTEHPGRPSEVSCASRVKHCNASSQACMTHPQSFRIPRHCRKKRLPHTGNLGQASVLSLPFRKSSRMSVLLPRSAAICDESAHKLVSLRLRCTRSPWTNQRFVCREFLAQPNLNPVCYEETAAAPHRRSSLEAS